MLVLTINAGGSSVKFTVYELPDTSDTRANAADITALHSEETGADVDRMHTLESMMKVHAGKTVAAVIHRLVHSGPDFTAPVIITDSVNERLQSLVQFDSLHMPPALEWVKVARSLHTDALQIATFDTTFFVDLPPPSQSYGVPHSWIDQYQVRRYGFHGMAHQSMVEIVSKRRSDVIDGGRMITLQLGSGCSVSAIVRGQPVDTSMGFAPLEGLLMSTRCGDIDPALVLYLMKQTNLSAEEMEKKLYFESGLLGLGGSKDMKLLLESNDSRAKLAVDVFLHRCVKYIGAYTALMGGVDTIVLAGGMGQKATGLRKRLVEALAFLSVKLDTKANDNTKETTLIASSASGAVQVWVAKIDEGSVMVENAREHRLLMAQR